MKDYLVDLHRLRHNPYNGLYTFCCSLGENLLRQPLEDEQLHYYLPKNKFGFFGDKPRYVEHKRSHKFFHTGTGKFAVWHLTTGISQYRPHNRKTKVVYTIHDVNFLVEDPNNTKRNNRSLRVMQRNVDRADHVVGISKYALDFASKHLDFGGKPTSVIYNGYFVSEFPEFNDPIYQPAKPFLFSISLVQPRKNFHVLAPLLIGNDYELVIAGLNHFDYAKTILQEARKWKVEDRVKLIGPVDEKNKFWYYSNCSAFMFPSIAEGFGIPPLEAMHFGKPVFLSRYMSLPEVGGDAAYYFNSFDPDDMKSVFEKGMSDYSVKDRKFGIQQHARRFDWNRTAGEYLSIYRQLTR
jgi:glycosyltransferase involved in cell wall biosynthesis